MHKFLWNVPAHLRSLIEQRVGRERRGGERRKRSSMLFRLLAMQDRRKADRRRGERRDDR